MAAIVYLDLLQAGGAVSIQEYDQDICKAHGGVGGISRPTNNSPFFIKAQYQAIPRGSMQRALR